MKTAFITGGGKGLGKGFADYFLNQNFLVFIGVRTPTIIEKQHKNLVVVKMDVTDDKSIQYAVNQVKKQTDHLDYLINNAGLNKDTATNNKKELVCNLGVLERKLLLNMFDVNSVSPMMVLKKFVDLLKKSMQPFVINISSNRASYSNQNTNGNYGYRASKIALNMMTLCTLIDLPKKIKTFAVHPGGVKTDMNPTGKQKPFEQAKKIIQITQDWQDALNGKFLNYDGTLFPL